MEAAALLNSTTIESLRGIETVKGNAAEEDTMEKIETRFIRTLRIAYRANVISNYQQVISSSISTVGSLLMMWVGAIFVMGGEITLGTLMAFSSLSGFFMGPIGRLVGLQFQIQEADIALKRLSEIFDVEEESEIHKGKGTPESLFGNISVSGLTFRYGFRKPVLSDVSFDIATGEKIALVGESGCGKTTICKIIMGLWVPESGKINIAGYDLEDLDMQSYRKRVAYVQQEVELFSGTITENIRVSVPSATDDDVRRACAMAGCADFIGRLPSRYDTYLEEAGANLSGGERQRLGLARAFAKKPEILILDEATSNLDFTSEAKVYDTLFNKKLRCTTIIVAHRLSTIRRCDRIFMIAEGKIAETGTHDELIENHGAYWKMWNSQVGNEVKSYETDISPVPNPPKSDEPDKKDNDDSHISYG
jgi:ATP-binding cassette subfamily B protein